MKFDPQYSLAVEVAGGGNVTLKLPLTVEFEVRRDSLASANTCRLVVYNLGTATRNRIYKDKYAVTEFRALQFRAGYEGFTPLIFNGTVKQAFSYRQGNNILTVIEGYDGGFQIVNGWTAKTIAGGSTAAQIISNLATSLPGIAGTPIVGDFPQRSLRGEVLFGNTWDLIQQKSAGVAAIDNGQVKVLGDNETIEGEIAVIESSTGLLGSPQRSDAQLEVTILFEPRLTVGQVVELRSTTNPLFNGRYKVMGFSHRGTISGAVAGQARVTTVSLWLGTQILRTIQGTPVQ